VCRKHSPAPMTGSLKPQRALNRPSTTPISLTYLDRHPMITRDKPLEDLLRGDCPRVAMVSCAKHIKLAHKRVVINESGYALAHQRSQAQEFESGLKIRHDRYRLTLGKLSMKLAASFTLSGGI